VTAAIGLPPPGALLDGGRFVLGDKYAEGGTSIVHLAMEKATERCVAVKLLIERYKGRPEREQRLIDEGLYLEQLRPSPYIVELVSHGRLTEHGGWPFVATEFMVGSSLRKLIVWDRDVPLPRACDIAHQLAQAIRFVHQRGIVHRDITTSNVYVCRQPLDDNGRDQVKLFDFSHAGRLDGPRGPRGTGGRITGAHDVPGTHGYMSPEQARAEPVTTAMDVFAFGAVLYELVTGHSLFDIRDRDAYIDLLAREGLEVPRLMAWAYEIPEALAELTNACTSLDPAARPSMDEIVERLAAIRAGLDTPSEPTERVPIERLPVRAPVVEEPRAESVQAEADQTDIELPFARPAHLRPVLSPVVAPPQVEPEPAVDASATSGEHEVDSAPGGATLKWVVAGIGLLLALGLGAWVWIGHDRETVKEDRDSSPVSVEPGIEPEPSAPDPSDSDTGSHLEPVPEVEGPKKNGEPETGEPNKKPHHEKPHHEKPTVETPKHATPECQAIRKETDGAMSARKWSIVLDHTERSASCWAKRIEPRRLRVEALAQSKAWAKCVEAGASSDDPAVVKWVEFCRGRVER